ncbi:hypothetical protein OG896_11020 [Streptomyces sp. NBC_00669]|uniref:hypothetical protein n=1 Tax=Streptomyces sp. NBC_00669 TaxID=2976011 RepID=UPI002E350BF9|nr:hypothetical protein [Streptomyces sp. NBC_00669]
MIIALITIGTTLLAPLWIVPVVVVGSLLGTGTVGALQLRHDDRLSERRFVELIKITFLNLSALLRRSHPSREASAIGQASLTDRSGQGTPPI